MKHPDFKILVAFVTLVFAIFSFQASAKDNAKIEFSETVYDFGDISLKGGRVSHEFKFTNAGEKNLVINDARASCGCTRPEYSEAPVAPGKEGKVKVTFVPAAKGSFAKKITVSTNGSPSKTRLIIKGVVVD